MTSMSRHLTLEGTWQSCRAGATCGLPFHLDAQINPANIPAEALCQLWESFDPPHRINSIGTKEWLDADGKRHRSYDLPAMIFEEGTRAWYQRGSIHREGDKPAILRSSGKREWYQRGRLHRDNDLPAVIEADGTQCWYERGLRHRTDEKPAVLYPDGRVEYWTYGQLTPLYADGTPVKVYG